MEPNIIKANALFQQQQQTDMIAWGHTRISRPEIRLCTSIQMTATTRESVFKLWSVVFLKSLPGLSHYGSPFLGFFFCIQAKKI